MPGTSKKTRERVGHTRLAYQGIRKLMFHNEVIPGQKIAYRDLAERLGMSQTPIIQALKWLEFQGLVRHEPNRGYFTEPIRIKEVAEIYRFRELIELSLLNEIPTPADDRSLDRLHRALEAHAAVAGEVHRSKRLLLDMEFHLELAALADNRVQHQALTNLFDLLYLKYGVNILFSTLMKTVSSDHQRIFELVAAGDAAAAGQVLSRHIRNVCNHVVVSLEDKLADQQSTAV